MSGHVRRRGARSWELKFDTGRDSSGRRITKYVAFTGSKHQARARLTELLSESARGVLVDVSKETLAVFADRWDRDWASHNLSPKTLERYRQLIAIQIAPSDLGCMALQKIINNVLNKYVIFHKHSVKKLVLLPIYKALKFVYHVLKIKKLHLRQ